MDEVIIPTEEEIRSVAEGIQPVYRTLNWPTFGTFHNRAFPTLEELVVTLKWKIERVATGHYNDRPSAGLYAELNTEHNRIEFGFKFSNQIDIYFPSTRLPEYAVRDLAVKDIQ